MSTSSRTRSGPGTIVAGLIVVVVLLVVAFAAATGVNLGGAVGAVVDSLSPPRAITTQAVAIRDLYNVVFFVAAAIFIGVEILIFGTVIKYRRKKGDDDLPAQTHGNNIAEFLWTIIPTVIVAWLFFISWQTLNTVEARSEQPAVQVTARAGQFQWSFDYLAADGKTIEYTQYLPTGENGGMFVPVGRPVLVKLESPDVLHAFYVPQFLFKKDVVPGQTNEFEFTLKEEEAGQTFRGQCAELCGGGHAAMIFDVHAMPAADFDAWLAEARASAQPSAQPSGGAASPGASLAPNTVTLAVTAQNIEFQPLELEAPAGQPFAIDFTNAENVPHDIAIDANDGTRLFDGETLPTAGKTLYQVPALDQGTYTFLCTIHPTQMVGNLTVQ